ncbi:uncharacterized protein LOC124927409 [Impatiens glandulifera]|uniref:uncharacterized protein LOC124927409 n=1 Tax=Impatiens glandulifera TaxID=253017 RepID=UPI001FB0685E|nr:uncharacterized protein LOC124927409 [Impatiens glandulifera]
MASPAPSNSSTAGRTSNKPLGLMANAIKRKHSFIQFFVMSSIMLMSFRSLGQKYKIYELEEDTYSLKQEQEGLINRMKSIKNSLLEEAARDPTGALSSRLRLLFGDNE